MYWQPGEFPDWAAINCFRAFPDRLSGDGVEPHYHDCDEIWLFSKGHDEVWLNDQRYEITPNTAVYTPMGVIHRFQVFSAWEIAALVTPMERKKRPIHILVKEEGPPEPTVEGFVVSGDKNHGPIADPGPRCPLSELRAVNFAEGKKFDEEN